MSALVVIVLLVAGILIVHEPLVALWWGLDSRCRHPYWQVFLGGVLVLVGLLVMVTGVQARPVTPTATPAELARVQIPAGSAHYRLQVRHVVADVFGLDGSPARLAAQIHQESLWRPKARSHVGAQGLAQFMPRTGRWLARIFPEIGPYDPWDPRWSIRAAATYDKYLLERNPGANACANWAFALASYNGGESALWREQDKAERAGLSPDLWFGNVASRRSRARWAWQENRHYVQRILTVLEPAYIAAGWQGKAVCA